RRLTISILAERRHSFYPPIGFTWPGRYTGLRDRCPSEHAQASDLRRAGAPLALLRRPRCDALRLFERAHLRLADLESLPRLDPVRARGRPLRPSSGRSAA